MQRDKYDSVTIAILVPVSSKEAEGETFYDETIRVRRFTNEDVDRNSTRGRSTWGQIEKYRQTELLRLIEFVRACTCKDPIAIEKAAIALKSHTAGPIALSVTKALIKEPGFAQTLLVKELSTRLDDVRLVLWQRDGKTAPGLLCPNVETALFIHVLMSAVAAKVGLRVCPKCGQPFMQKRLDQDYCSVKCREAHRVERWRAQKVGTLKTDRTANKRSLTKRGETR